jgi:hypothetical protein
MNPMLLLLLLLMVFGDASSVSKRWSRCDQPGVVSFVFKCIHQDSARYTLKHFKDIPITIMFNLIHFKDESKIKLHQHMSRMGHEVGLFVDHPGRDRFEDDLRDAVFLASLKKKFKKLFWQDLKFVYAAWTLTSEQTRILQANGLRSVLASFDFSDASFSALDIAEYHASDPNQRSFIVVPDTHRPDGNSLVSDLAEIFDTAGFDAVTLSECYDVPFNDPFLRDEL